MMTNPRCIEKAVLVPTTAAGSCGPHPFRCQAHRATICSTSDVTLQILPLFPLPSSYYAINLVAMTIAQ